MFCLSICACATPASSTRAKVVFINGDRSQGFFISSRGRSRLFIPDTHLTLSIPAGEVVTSQLAAVADVEFTIGKSGKAPRVAADLGAAQLGVFPGIILEQQ